MSVLSTLLLLTTIGFANIANAWVTVSTKEWAQLDHDIEGSVILPTDEDYSSEYVLWSSTFDNVYPSAIVKCENGDDVQRAYQLILDHYEKDMDSEASLFSVRCGAHNMIGASTTSGVVIDVSGLNQLGIKTNNADNTKDDAVTAVDNEETAIVGPGVNLSQFTAWAEENDVTLPHGDCASVTFGGFLLGGGLGLTSRTFGLGGDWVKSFTIVLSTGELVTATDSNEYKDLFWAVLGGGGQNFGIVTEYEMNIPAKHQVNPGLYVELTWDYDYESWQKVSAGWKQFMNNEEYQDHFAMYLRIQPVTYLTQEYYIGLHGFWTGEQTTGLLVLAELLTEINLTPATAKIDYVHFEGWIESSSADRVRYSSECKSRWALDELDQVFFEELAKSVEMLMTYEPLDILMDETDDASYVYPTQFVFISPADGAINTKDEMDDGRISFVHRDAKYFVAMCGRWRDGYLNAEKEMRSWLTETMNRLEPHLSKYSFVSFPDWDLENWEEAYYRHHYPLLQQIKAKYDPNYMFRYSQSIVPSGWTFNTNEMLKLPIRQEYDDNEANNKVTLYREKELKEKKLMLANSVNNNNDNGYNSDDYRLNILNVKSYKFWCLIIAGMLLGFITYHSIQASKKKDIDQYTPLNDVTYQAY